MVGSGPNAGGPLSGATDSLCPTGTGKYVGNRPIRLSKVTAQYGGTHAVTVGARKVNFLRFHAYPSIYLPCEGHSRRPKSSTKSQRTKASHSTVGRRRGDPLIQRRIHAPVLIFVSLLHAVQT